jgi:hypothetical protein
MLTVTVLSPGLRSISLFSGSMPAFAGLRSTMSLKLLSSSSMRWRCSVIGSP